jgi:hypothetical protein
MLTELLGSLEKQYPIYIYLCAVDISEYVASIKSHIKEGTFKLVKHSMERFSLVQRGVCKGNDASSSRNQSSHSQFQVHEVDYLLGCFAV